MPPIRRNPNREGIRIVTDDNDRSPATENSMFEPEDSPRPHFYVAHLETLEGQDWTSLGPDFD
jgi:hypothetical protein